MNLNCRKKKSKFNRIKYVKTLLRVVLVNVRNHDDIFVQSAERYQYPIEFDLTDQTKNEK